MTLSLIAAGVSFVLTLLIGKFLIPELHKLKAGQEIREDGPTWHKAKAGTPTMGGIMFILGAGVTIFALGWSYMLEGQFSHLYVYLFALIFGLIGFVDDYRKVRQHQNEGLTARQKFILQLAAAVVFLVLYVSVMGYAGDRITAWLNPEADAQDKGYQVLQSQYAIGSGGLFGLGFGMGRQKHLYLPEEHNDYIFAIVCEELGLIGAVGIIILFALLIIRGYWIAMHAADRFSTMLAVGITTLLAVQVVLNMGVVSNLLPSTGVGLPFFSYGGTNLMMNLGEMGIMLSISRWSSSTRG